MSSEAVKSLVEQMSGVMARYLDQSPDWDHFGADEIHSNIMYLQEILNNPDSNDELNVVMGLISQIIPHLYVARGYATTDVPRDYTYYSSMGAAQNLFRQIRKIGKGPSIIENIFDFFKPK